MNDQSVARRYAKAIFELALESGSLEKTGSDLFLAAAAADGTPELTASLASPALEKRHKEKLIENFLAAAKLGELVSNSIRLLADRGRFALISNVAHHYSSMKDEHDGIVRGDLVSAAELSPAEIAVIQDKLSRRLGKKVIMNISTDGSLIGGIVVQIAGKTIDGSLKGQLRAMARALKGC